MGNKILISSVLIVLADLKVVHVAIIAWVIGIEFLLSGVDLLKRSLYQESSQSLFFYKKSFLEIFLLFFLLMIFAFQSSLSVFFYQFVQMGISLVWVFLAAFFMISSLVSKRFQALLKEA
ncbi:MAG: hypothetical protein HYS07_02045 [Chlamydiae bacterium]|nr:hypothetical protein [Chlamydiota bacterium]